MKGKITGSMKDKITGSMKDRRKSQRNEKTLNCTSTI